MQGTRQGCSLSVYVCVVFFTCALQLVALACLSQGACVCGYSFQGLASRPYEYSRCFVHTEATCDAFLARLWLSRKAFRVVEEDLV